MNKTEFAIPLEYGASAERRELLAQPWETSTSSSPRLAGRRFEQLTSEERAQIWALAAPVMEPGFEVVPHSDRDESDPVEVVPYNAEWPRRFGIWRERLSRLLPLKPMRPDSHPVVPK